MYDSYKPLRNYLRQFSQVAALAVVYRFMQFIQHDTPLPPEFDNPQLHQKNKWDSGIFEWELETLAREIILNCPPRGTMLLDTWGKFATALNHVKRVENDAWASGDHAPDILMELLRLAHRQFHWQQGVDETYVTRFFKLYDHPRMRPLFEAEFGMTTLELYQIGIALVGSLHGSMIIRTPLSNQINIVPGPTVDGFVARLTKPLPDLREEIVALQEYNVNWAYAFNPLWLHPLIRLAEGVVLGPMPALLLYRITSGVYFDLVPHGDAFGAAMGIAFQDYTGASIRAADKAGKFIVLEEVEYGTRKKRKDSVDWIVQDDSATLFVECKARRMRVQGKIDLVAKQTIEDEIKRLAGFVTQLYTTLSDALAGKYNHWQPDDIPVYPIVVTVDEWHAFGSASDIIDEAVRTEFGVRGLDPNLLKTCPYQVWSIRDFEHSIQLMAQRGIEALMKEKTTEEKRGFPMNNYMLDYARHHGLQLEPLFPNPVDPPKQKDGEA